MARTSAKSNGHRNGTNSGDSRFYNDALGVVSSLLSSRKSSSGEKINNFADAAREFSASIGDMPNMQKYANLAADQLDNFSKYVTETDLEDMMHDASKFARSRPLATLGFAIAVGYGLTRFVNTQTSMFARSQPRSKSKAQNTSKVRGKNGRKSSSPSADGNKAHA